MINYTKYAEEQLKILAIENRETCRHFIDYDIYDSLTDELKQRYINQFYYPKIILSKSHEEKEFSLKLLCKANEKDCITRVYCDCSESYPKTFEHFNTLTKYVKW